MVMLRGIVVSNMFRLSVSLPVYIKTARLTGTVFHETKEVDYGLISKIGTSR